MKIKEKNINSVSQEIIIDRHYMAILIKNISSLET